MNSDRNPACCWLLCHEFLTSSAVVDKKIVLVKCKNQQNPCLLLPLPCASVLGQRARALRCGCRRPSSHHEVQKEQNLQSLAGHVSRGKEEFCGMKSAPKLCKVKAKTYVSHCQHLMLGKTPAEPQEYPSAETFSSPALAEIRLRSRRCALENATVPNSSSNEQLALRRISLQPGWQPAGTKYNTRLHPAPGALQAHWHITLTLQASRLLVQKHWETIIYWRANL